MRLRVAALALAVTGAAFGLPVSRPQQMEPGPIGVSPPLWLMRPGLVVPPPEDHEPRRVPLTASAELVRDPVVQRSVPALLSPSTKLNFDGIGLGTVGVPAGDLFQVQVDPPDPQGDVGPNHYVQIVNSSLAVFSKAGALLLGPVPTQVVFAGLAAPCAKGGYDGIVLYDSLADRWLVTQLSWDNQFNGPFWECIAVSRTGDPTGQYWQYAYSYANFNDYPKFGVWPDGYYATYNIFGNASPAARLVARRICAFERARMLAGQPAQQQCADITLDEVSGLTPADFDGELPPPVGAPGTALGFFQTETLVLYRFHVDWSSSANSSIDAVAMPAAPFQPLCSGTRGGACVAQLNGQGLDGLGDRIMFRVAYRNMGAYESLVANQNVAVSSAGGVRWYEVRDPAGDPFVYQQGTYAPDSNSRWMGSAAMDRAGNIGLGFSIAGPGQNVGIGITAHAGGDPPGVMGAGETSLPLPGQGGEQISRWGDYSSMSVDPSDDCTFWYTAEYVPFDAARWTWRTRVASFEVPGCSTAPDFSVWVPVDRGSVRRGDAVNMVVSTAALRHTAAGTPIQLSIAPAPLAAGVVADVQPAVVMPGESATLHISSASASSIGEVPFTVVATAGAVTVSTNASVAVIDSDFAISADKSSTTLGQGGTTDVHVTVSPLFGAPEVVIFSATGLPRGVQASFDPIYARVGESTTLRLQSTAFLSPGVSNVKVTAAGTLTSHTATVRLRTLFQPVVAIGDPRPYSQIRGKVRVAVSAGASLGTTLKTIQMYLDGQSIPGLSAETSPAEMFWNTESADDGPHYLTARATDAEGNEGSSAPVAIWIQNKGDCGCSAQGGGWEALGLLGLLAVVRRRMSRQARA